MSGIRGSWKKRGEVWGDPNGKSGSPEDAVHLYDQIYWNGDDPLWDFTQYDHAWWLNKKEKRALNAFHERGYYVRSRTMTYLDLEWLENLQNNYAAALAKYEAGPTDQQLEQRRKNGQT